MSQGDVQSHQERVLRRLIRTQVAELADSGEYPRRLTAVLHDKVPRLALAAATNIAIPERGGTQDTPAADTIVRGLLAHANWLAVYQRDHEARLGWPSMRRDLLKLLPCCSTQKGSFPFCDPRC